MTNRSKINFILNTIFYSVVGILLFLAVRFLLAYLFPVLIGIAITVVVQRPAKVISSKLKIKKGYCALFLVLTSYLLIVTILGFVVYKGGIYIADILGSGIELVKRFSSVSDKFIESIDDFIYKLPDSVRGFIENTVSGIISSISGYISNFAKRTAGSVPMFLTGSIVTIVASCYIARDFDRFKDSVKSVLSKKVLTAYRMTAELFRKNILKLALGYMKLLLLTFFELYVGFVVIGIESPLLLAIVIAFLDLLPIIGTGTILVPWSIFELISDNVFIGLSLLALYIIIIVIRNIIEPKIIGKQMGLHPLIALIVVFIGLKLMGFIGIFILPFTVMFVYQMYDNGIFEILFSNRKISGE